MSAETIDVAIGDHGLVTLTVDVSWLGLDECEWAWLRGRVDHDRARDAAAEAL